MALVASLLSKTPASAVSVESLKESKLDWLANVVQSRRCLKYCLRFIQTAQWDKARSYIVYCTRNMHLKSSMRNAAETLSDDDSYLTAMSATAELDICLTQLDASVYADIFIPADEDKLSPEAVRYQNEAYDYHKMALEYIATFLGMFPDEMVKQATELAMKRKEELFLPADLV